MAGGSVAKLGTYAYAGTFKLYTFFPWWFLFFSLPNCWLCLILGKLPPTCCTTGGSRRHVEESSVKTAGEKVSRETERKAGLQNLC